MFASRQLDSIRLPLRHNLCLHPFLNWIEAVSMRLASSSLLSAWCALSVLITFGLEISPDGALTSSTWVFDSAGWPNVAPGHGLSQWSSPCEGNNNEVEVGVRVECAEDVK